MCRPMLKQRHRWIRSEPPTMLYLYNPLSPGEQLKIYFEMLKETKQNTIT